MIIRICDVCLQRPAGIMESFRVEDGPAWNVCGTCMVRPFRRPPQTEATVMLRRGSGGTTLVRLRDTSTESDATETRVARKERV